MESRVKVIAEELEKPDLDDRSYRVIELPNKLEALLVHDPQTDKASASLNVNVGNFSDADDMPGMAHAVEHLLFMGTEKYPVENEYGSYLSANSGYSNAYTAATQTNYFFECAAASEGHEAKADGVDSTLTNGTTRGPFYGALDRFAQFFVKPLFLENTLDRELRAVDSENKKNLQQDVWRLSQLAKSLSNPKHPYHHFSTGNLQTLRDDPEKRGVKIRDAFIEFYEKHYSANRMKLVVLGKEPLDELESWVVELFSEVKNKNLSQNRWDDARPLEEPQLGTEIFAKPVMESRSLGISFPWQDEEDMYETQPSRYISHLIGHEGPGSILAYLKSQGLANSLSCGAHTICPGSAFLEIEISMTPEGLKRYRDIVKIVFQYIGLIKEEPPVEWMFDEMKNMAEVDFKFRQKSPASRFASGTSSVMQKPLPRKWLLSGTSKIRRYDAKAIVNAMQFLREDNFRLMVVSQDYPVTYDHKEKWYGTDYRVDKIPEKVIEEIRQAIRTDTGRPLEIHLPHKNEFIPTRLDVEKTDIAKPAVAPRLLRDDDKLRLWWKKDDTFWVPKAALNVQLRNPVAYDSPASHVKGAIFVNLVKDALQEYAYDADISGLAYELHPNTIGLELNVQGYNDKLSVLLEKVLLTIRDIELKQDRFDIIKERFERKYKNWGFQQPYYQVGDFSRLLIDQKRFYTPQYAAELPQITLEDVKSFAKELTGKAHVEMLVHGNVYRDEARKMASLLESILNPQLLPREQWPVRRNMILPPGSNFVYQHTLSDPENVNHAIEYYVQVGSVSDAQLRARLQLVAQMTDEPAFDQLRTKEQLGYVVWSGTRNANTIMGYRVLIQSERTPEYLESRIDTFLAKFKKDLVEMSTEDFEKHKRSLIQKRQEKLKNLSAETGRLWSYILGEMYNFFQIDVDVEHIRKTTKDDVIEFFNQYIDPESASRAKLSVHLRAQKVAKVEEPNTDEQRQQLAGVISQYLTAQGTPTTTNQASEALANIPPHDQPAIITATKSLLLSSSNSSSNLPPPQNAIDPTDDLAKALPQIFTALKIQSPEQKDEVAHAEAAVTVSPTMPPPTIIDDVAAWKGGLRATEGIKPVCDVRDFLDGESKL